MTTKRLMIGLFAVLMLAALTSLPQSVRAHSPTGMGIGYEPEGHISLSGKKVDPATDRHLSMVLKGSRLCNNAVLEKKKRHWSVIGDPTEGALVVLAEKVGFTKKRPRFHVRKRDIKARRKARAGHPARKCPKSYPHAARGLY